MESAFLLTPLVNFLPSKEDDDKLHTYPQKK